MNTNRNPHILNQNSGLKGMRAYTLTCITKASVQTHATYHPYYMLIYLHMPCANTDRQMHESIRERARWS